MATTPGSFVTPLHPIGLSAALVITATVAWILVTVASGRGIPLGPSHPAIWGTAVILGLTVLIEQLLMRLLIQRVLKSSGKVAAVAMRVSEGNLILPNWAGRD